MTSRYGYAEDGNTAWCVVDYERGGATVSRHHMEQDARAEAARLNAAAGKHETPRLYTEAEVAAREAAAAEEMREAWIESEARDIYLQWRARPDFAPWQDGGKSALQERARKEARRHVPALPAPGALSRARAEAWREGMEVGFDLGFAASGEGWNGEHPGDAQGESYYQTTKAAAIRARMEESNAG